MGVRGTMLLHRAWIAGDQARVFRRLSSHPGLATRQLAPLGTRDGAAADLTAAFDFGQQPDLRSAVK